MAEKKKVERMVTSIKVDPQVWKNAKKSAIDLDMEVSEVVEQALTHWVNVESAKILKERK